jgi:catechol 2,3-dioxygenase
MFEANLTPAFNVTRASHAVLTARDLDATEAFYCDLLGLIKSDRDRNALYLRGIEERSHHSLVFHRSDVPPACERVGLRMLTDDDLKRAYDYFGDNVYAPKWADVPYQGLTLHLDDSIGTPLEFCATMDDLPSHLQKFEMYKGASRQCLLRFAQ